ncbi:MAG: ABC transporter permease subunit/CPBP intramembrane protease [Gemmatimonadota bacterium]
MNAPWWVVFRKELRETLRDRRTLFVMIAVPVLLYPAVLIGTEQLYLLGTRNLESETSSVAVVGDAPESLLEVLGRTESLTLTSVEGDPVEAVRLQTVNAVVVMGRDAGTEGTREITLLYNAASDRSQRAHAELRRSLDAWGDTVLVRRLRDRGLPATFAAPVAVADSSIARPTEMGGYTMGRILPLLLVMMTVLGAFYPAIDLAAGEKERGTLETLLTAPVPAGAVVAGKFVTVALIGVVAAGLNLASMLLTFQTGVLQVTEVIGLEVSLQLRSVLAIFLTLIPLAVLFGAVFLGLAVRSSSFKEAQNALTPIYMLALFPAMLPLFPGIDFGPLFAVMPVAGVAFLFRDLMVGDADWWLGSLVLAATTFYAAAALVFAARAFGNERVLFGGDEPSDVASGSWLGRLWNASRPGRVPTPAEAGFFVAMIAVLFFLGGVRMQLAWGEGGVLASEWTLLLVPAVLFVFGGRFDPRATLSLRRPRGRHLLAGILLIAGGLPIVWLVGWLQNFVLPVPREVLDALEQMMTAQSPQRFLWLLLIVAVTPALCEEIVFRGVLLGGTRRLEPWRMVVLNGLVFGAFHVSSETLIRFLPTAMLGTLIAWAVWRTGSIWVGALMHFVNNGTILLITSLPAIRAAFSDPETPPPVWLVPAGVVVLGLGILTMLRTTEPGGDASGDAVSLDPVPA